MISAFIAPLAEDLMAAKTDVTRPPFYVNSLISRFDAKVLAQKIEARAQSDEMIILEQLAINVQPYNTHAPKDHFVLTDDEETKKINITHYFSYSKNDYYIALVLALVKKQVIMMQPLVVDPVGKNIFLTQFSSKDVAHFGALTGDYNPLHFDAQLAHELELARPVVHGAFISLAVEKAIIDLYPSRQILSCAARFMHFLLIDTPLYIFIKNEKVNEATTRLRVLALSDLNHVIAIFDLQLSQKNQ